MIIASKAASAAVGGLEYRWVLGLANGNLYTSDVSDMATWTTRTSSFGATAIYGVASNGRDMYVAVGASGKLATSPDGITWTQRTSSFSTTNINGIAFGNGVWVAVGDSGKIATATDPTGTWTQRTSGVATALYGIQYGASIWVTTGASNVIRSATDPTSTWTARTNAVGNAGQWNSLRWCPSQGVFLTGEDGTAPEIASSTDGITWTGRTLATDPLGNNFVPISNSSVIAGGLVITATTSDIDTSTNGTTWTARTPAWTNRIITAQGVDGAGRMVFVGSSATNNMAIQTSDDGTTWTNRTVPVTTTSSCYAFCHSSGG